ncbi:hypothetical protein MNBD_GAMMA09-510 [hydrothermal vent metagenome]|uniref:Uncharacterized protein n=1 Tax=hydrothermal vent metagenome TaxID=652676 RepID=A0A3B0XF76_9ZZZZ
MSVVFDEVIATVEAPAAAQQTQSNESENTGNIENNSEAMVRQSLETERRRALRLKAD